MKLVLVIKFLCEHSRFNFFRNFASTFHSFLVEWLPHHQLIIRIFYWFMFLQHCLISHLKGDDMMWWSSILAAPHHLSILYCFRISTCLSDLTIEGPWYDVTCDGDKRSCSLILIVFQLFSFQTNINIDIFIKVLFEACNIASLVFTYSPRQMVSTSLSPEQETEKLCSVTR